MRTKPHLISSFHLYWKAKGKPEEVYKGNKLLPVFTVSFVCPLCRFESYKGFRWKDVNLSVFTNWDWFCDDVPYLCPACTAVLKDDKLRRRDVIVTENEVIYLQKKNLEDREKIMDFIFNPSSLPFVVSIPSSYKKHVLPRAIVNVSSRHVAVQYEEETIWINVERDRPIFEIIKRLRSEKVSNTQIEQVDFDTTRTKKIFSEHELSFFTAQLKPYRGTALLNFLITMAKPE